MSHSKLPRLAATATVMLTLTVAACTDPTVPAATTTTSSTAKPTTTTAKPTSTTAKPTTTTAAPTTTTAKPTTTTAAPTTTTAPAPIDSNALTTLFPIGVFVPPAYLMNTWKSRGANFALQVPDGNDRAEWDAAAAAAGMRTIRLPQTSVAADSTNRNLMGFFQRDEPDGIYQQIPYTQIQQQYAANKAAMPNMPVLINFVGALNQYDVQTGESGPAWYQKYMSASDWVAGDTYPINNCEAITNVGVMVTKLRAWSGGKPTFAAIETGDYDTTNSCPGPSADQVRAQIWSAIANGVRGIYYFPVRIAPSFAFDVTPAAVATEMTKQHATIASLTSVLQPYAINPSTLGASLPAGLQAGWRDTPQGKYFFVVNMTANTLNAQKLQFSGVGSATSATVLQENRSVSVSAGAITDSFGPYAVHIYKI